MARVRVEGIEKRFVANGRPVDALCGLSLDVEDGTCTAILGPSGCGKTTLLRVIAGLEKPDAGRVSFDERNVTSEPVSRVSNAANAMRACAMRRDACTLPSFSIARHAGSRAGNVSALPWRGRSHLRRTSCYSTNRFRVSTRRCGVRYVWNSNWRFVKRMRPRFS